MAFLLLFILLKLNSHYFSDAAVKKLTAMTWSSKIADAMVDNNFSLVKKLVIEKNLNHCLLHNKTIY